ncbi:MAG: radical SAM protein [Myxococcales bacterium]
MAREPEIHLNLNVRSMGASATVAIDEHCNALREAGREVYKLALGQSPFPVPDDVVQALRDHAHEKDYQPVRGLRALRDAVAALPRPASGRALPATTLRPRADRHRPHRRVAGPGNRRRLIGGRGRGRGRLDGRWRPPALDAGARRRSMLAPAGARCWRPPALDAGARRRHGSGWRPVAPEPIQIAGLTSEQMAAEARRRLPRGHGVARAVYRDAMRAGRFDPASHGLGPEARAAFGRAFAFGLPEVTRVVSEETAAGETAKQVLRLPDGLEYESVLLPMGHGRHTLCVSSQVGCKMGCRFCETGRMGILRNLTTAEIVSQLLVARHVHGWPVRNLVFMGMGEALDNADAVIGALRVLTDPGGLAIAQERLTVCTVGRIDGIRRLAAEGFKRLNLSVSLNAPDDPLRDQLMPVNRRTPLSELQAALAEYRPRANFALGVNYCLLPGINAAREHARGVARFCEPLGRVMVNVIPYNPGSDPLTRAPSDEETDRFIGWLRDAGLPVRRRITKGRSVMAACGQLGNVRLRRAHRDRRL